MSLALGLPAIDALVADGAEVGPLMYCLGHQRLLVPVEGGTFHRWGAAHSDCVPGARTGRCVSDGYGGRSCTGLWVTRPEPVVLSTTPAAALHEALSRTRDRMRVPRNTPVPQRREVCRA
ncbi:hypothetical protein ABZ501_27315 [Streptomyces sp. NPDC019922]|uniref:hypothetical protein n=1 Tax=Streptomyces TaxID=1883 RepID=UPI0029BF83E5|nr:hypothetical protein [Streptomyces sp. WI03-5b]MDX2623779.1 hypothetical protein [Streptomyces sp. WI03-5b]